MIIFTAPLSTGLAIAAIYAVLQHWPLRSWLGIAGVLVCVALYVAYNAGVFHTHWEDGEN